MDDSTDWVEDVKRWCRSGAVAAKPRTRSADDGDDKHTLGYEAANPVLQAANWPEMPAHNTSLHTPMNLR